MYEIYWSTQYTIQKELLWTSQIDMDHSTQHKVYVTTEEVHVYNMLCVWSISICHPCLWECPLDFGGHVYETQKQMFILVHVEIYSLTYVLFSPGAQGGDSRNAWTANIHWCSKTVENVSAGLTHKLFLCSPYLLWMYSFKEDIV